MLERQSPTTPTPVDRPDDEAGFARRVLSAEADAVSRIEIGPTFHEAVDLVLRMTDTADVGGGALVVTGLGKSGLIAQKLSATFVSTGTHSHYLHPTEAMHGDLGRIRSGDVVLALSRSGRTEEVVALASILRQDKVPVISITGDDGGDLARLATISLSIGNVTEACPMNLAPTASTTAMLALGDALALTVSRRRNFGVDDFQKVHPGGSLGRQLMPVVQAMRFRVGDNLPLVRLGQTLADAYEVSDAVAAASGPRRAGALLVVDEDGQLAGIFTDGDLRRLVVRDGSAVMSRSIDEVMSANPRRLTDDALVRDAVQVVLEHRIDEVPIVDAEGKPLGLIDVQDLMALKVIEG